MKHAALALFALVAAGCVTPTDTSTSAGVASLQTIQDLFVAPIAEISVPLSISNQWASVAQCAFSGSSANGTTGLSMPSPLVLFQSSADTIIADADSVNAYQLAPFPQYSNMAFLYQPSSNTTVGVVPSGFFAGADSVPNARLFDMNLISFTLYTAGTTYAVPAACEYEQ